MSVPSAGVNLDAAVPLGEKAVAHDLLLRISSVACHPDVRKRYRRNHFRTHTTCRTLQIIPIYVRSRDKPWWIGDSRSTSLLPRTLSWKPRSNHHSKVSTFVI